MKNKLLNLLKKHFSEVQSISDQLKKLMENQELNLLNHDSFSENKNVEESAELLKKMSELKEILNSHINEVENYSSRNQLIMLEEEIKQEPIKTLKELIINIDDRDLLETVKSIKENDLKILKSEISLDQIKNAYFKDNAKELIKDMLIKILGNEVIEERTKEKSTIKDQISDLFNNPKNIEIKKEQSQGMEI